MKLPGWATPGRSQERPEAIHAGVSASGIERKSVGPLLCPPLLRVDETATPGPFGALHEMGALLEGSFEKNTIRYAISARYECVSHQFQRIMMDHTAAAWQTAAGGTPAFGASLPLCKSYFTKRL
jgi:hypothetical protein